MYLSPNQTRHLSEVMKALAGPLSGDALRTAVITPIARLLDADYVASYVWDSETRRFGRGVCCGGDQAHLADYEQRYQFDDPITLRLHHRRVPTLVTEVMTQRALVSTDFFNRFLRADGLYWGVNLFVHDGQNDLGDLRIWRRRGRQNFDAHEVEVLKVLYPAMHEAMGRAHAMPVESLVTTPSGAAVWERYALRHGLSRRESEVAQLVADGLSDKLIAQQLGIAFTTVRTHLGNALRKTGLSNRRELMRHAA